MFCQNCGKEMPETAAFCPNCGANNGNEAVSEQPVAATAPAQEPATPPVAPQPQPPVAPQPQPPVAPQPQPPVAPVYSSGAGYAPAPPMPPVKKKSRAGLIIGIILGVIALIAVIAIVIGVVVSNSNPQKKFYGQWTGTIDFTDMMKKEMGDSAQYFDDDFSLSVDLDFYFKDDNTYEVKVNEDSLAATQKNLQKDLEKAALKAIRETAGSYFDGYTDAEIESFFKESTGQSIQEYIVEVLEEIKLEDLKKELNISGNFAVKDEKLYFLDSGTSGKNESTYCLYSMTNDNELRLRDFQYAMQNKEYFPKDIVLNKIK